jgi:hypothetical protein
LRRNKILFTKIQNTNKSKHAHNSVFFRGLQKDNEGKTKRKPIDLKTISYETKNKNPTILDKEEKADPPQKGKRKTKPQI